MNYSAYQSGALEFCDHTFSSSKIIPNPSLIKPAPTSNHMDRMRGCRVPLSLCPDNCRTPKIYLLPKIHISGNQSRPIVSSIVTPIERTSAFLDRHLEPFAQFLSSYINDINHFLSTIHSISDALPADTILVTVDVTSLYIKIPHTHGLAALGTLC